MKRCAPSGRRVPQVVAHGLAAARCEVRVLATGQALAGGSVAGKGVAGVMAGIATAVGEPQAKDPGGKADRTWLAGAELPPGATQKQRGFSVSRSEAVKKWDWLRAEAARTRGFCSVARCLSQFFHSLSRPFFKQTGR